MNTVFACDCTFGCRFPLSTCVSHNSNDGFDFIKGSQARNPPRKKVDPRECIASPKPFKIAGFLFRESHSDSEPEK